MDYEKAYKEALNRARLLKDNPSKILEKYRTIHASEYIFPELRESEEVKIKKELIQNLKERFGTKGTMGGNLDMPKVLAWLEKQGEIDKVSYEVAEKEKREFIGDGFIKCYADFQDFKEGETYWLEYLGNDDYNVRSDNLLGKTYHITPCQLYTIFKKQTWLEKQVTPQVRTGVEWVNAIDDACDKRYSEEYAEGEYCHEQSFKWGFQEGVDWLEKQGEVPVTINIDKMVRDYANNKESDNEEFGKPVNCMIRAYRQGLTDAIATLNIENRGEQKSFDYENANIVQKDFVSMVNPKFKVGDWVATNLPNRCSLLHITWFDETHYRTETQQGETGYLSINSIDAEYHLWTIEDAKDGDVLLSPSTDKGDKGSPFIFKEIDKNGIVRHHVVLLQNKDVVISNDVSNVMGYADARYHIPASKEQCDTLFAKMREEGYEWDAVNKELKKLSI